MMHLTRLYRVAKAIYEIIISIKFPWCFVMTETNADIDAMHITANPKFQPYLVQALATFQVDKASKDKGKQHTKFNSIHIPPCKKPENCATTVSKELFSPEIQKSTKKAESASSSTSVPTPPPQRSIQAPPVAGPSGSDSMEGKPTSTSTLILPHTPPINLQALIPTNQYKYLFLLEDETAPPHIFDHILDTNIPVPVKDLFAVSLDIHKHLQPHHHQMSYNYSKQQNCFNN